MESQPKNYTDSIPFICLKALFLEPSSVNLLKLNNNPFSFIACGFTYCHIETLPRGTGAEELYGLFNKIIFLFEKSGLLVTGRKTELAPDMDVSAVRNM